MKRKLFIISLFSIYSLSIAQVGINTQSPHPSSIFEVNSDTKGMVVPRLTTAAVTNLTSTATEGLIVFDKNQKKFLGWTGAKWVDLGFESGGSGSQTGIILVQGFEATSTLNYTTSGSAASFAFTSGNTGTGDAPSSTPMYSEGARGFGYSNASGTTSYIEFNTVDASAYSNNITFSFDVASFSIGSTANGADNTDFVSIEVSTDGGATYAAKLTLLGGNSSTGSNVKWAFAGTGTGTNTFAGSNQNVSSPNTSTNNNITVTGTQAITKLSVTGIPNSNQLKLRIGVKNNAASELWTVDNVKLEAL